MNDYERIFSPWKRIKDVHPTRISFLSSNTIICATTFNNSYMRDRKAVDKVKGQYWTALISQTKTQRSKENNPHSQYCKTRVKNERFFHEDRSAGPRLVVWITYLWNRKGRAEQSWAEAESNGLLHARLQLQLPAWRSIKTKEIEIEIAPPMADHRDRCQKRMQLKV